MHRSLGTVLTRTAAISGALTLLILTACGGGGGGGGYGGGTTGGTGAGGYGGGGTGMGAGASAYAMTALVSNGIVSAKTKDATLVNPWGISFAPGQPVWTANNGSQTSTLYDGNGQKNGLTVALPAGENGPANPTGIVFNSGAGFVIENGNTSGPAQFIFAGEAGTIAGWADTVDLNNAITGYDDRAGGAVYKGLAIATDGTGTQHLYAADFHNAKIDEFDPSFAKMPLGASAFADPTVPPGYAPFNIQAIVIDNTTLLYVTYAKPQQPANRDPVTGSGLGIIDVFDTQGTLKTHLVASGGKLNAPWGVVLAPANFGTFSGDLLVGNFGDGWINAYDPASGTFKGTLSDANGQPIVNPGLWGISFGNGAASQPTTTLFFAAGPDNEADGVYGRVDLAK